MNQGCRVVWLLVLVLILTTLPAIASEEIGDTTRIDDPDFMCGWRCPNPPTNACVSDMLTYPENWCMLTPSFGDCEGGYDPDLCGSESAF